MAKSRLTKRQMSDPLMSFQGVACCESCCEFLTTLG
jgi:hypothetical protein